MRKFKCQPFYDIEVDLDDPKTYEHLPQTASELDNKIFQEIGYALTYMDYFHPEFFPKRKKLFDTRLNSGYTQRQRVYSFIKEFSQERRNHYGDVLWLQEKLFLFEDEIENMC